jgi:hypothetical protein
MELPEHFALNILGFQGREKRRLALTSYGGELVIALSHTDGTEDWCGTLTAREAEDLIKGLRDTLTGHCGVSRKDWNRFCKDLEVHATLF